MSSTPTTPSNPHDSQDQDLPLMHGPSGPLAAAALILGLFSVLLLFYRFAGGAVVARDIGPDEPPSIIAVNLSFAALLFGIATVYRIRGMKGQGLTRLAGILGILLGLAGPAIYARQALTWRVRMENTELAHAATIAHAARDWATAHGGQFPPDLATLIADQKLKPNELQSPFGPRKPIPPATGPGAAHRVDEASDFVYMGAGLHDLADHPTLAPKIVLIVSRETRLRSYFTVAFADGNAIFLKHTDIAATWSASNDARKTLGLGPMVAPSAATEPVLPGQ